MAGAIKIGIIGGSGLDNPDIMENRAEKDVDTSYGKPSSSLVTGTISNIPCVLLARHGRGHTIYPTGVNYRANIMALVNEGCTHVIATTACGSLKEEIVPGNFLILDQFIDRTTKREMTLYDGKEGHLKGVCHIPMAYPFCQKTREVLIQVAKDLNITCFPSGTVVTIEGPRFSSLAECLLYRSWGVDVINMSTVPEVVLAKEAGLCYVSMAMATDYDCWHETEVNVASIFEVLKKNAQKALDIIVEAIPRIAQQDWTSVIDESKKLVTSSTF